MLENRLKKLEETLKSKSGIAIFHINYANDCEKLPEDEYKSFEKWYIAKFCQNQISKQIPIYKIEINNTMIREWLQDVQKDSLFKK